MINTFPVYQIIDHPTLTKKLREVCKLDLNDSDIEAVSRLSDLGDCLYLLTADALKRICNRHSVVATILTIDTRTPCAIDLKQAFA